MCLAIPGRITRLDGDTAFLDYGGIEAAASSALFPQAAVGDRALVHAGFIIQLLSPDEGEELERLIEETTAFAETELDDEHDGA